VLEASLQRAEQRLNALEHKFAALEVSRSLSFGIHP
jgi:hypothetical protein